MFIPPPSGVPEEDGRLAELLQVLQEALVFINTFKGKQCK